MGYKAPIIKNRTASGDSKYLMSNLPDGRVDLLSSPDNVTEPGTDINKELLQPLVDAVELHDNKLVPYSNYWWVRRTIAGSYYETLTTDGFSSGYYSATTFYYSYQYICFFLSRDNGDTVYSSATVSYSGNINMNQSTGAITLASPTTITITEGQYTNEQLANMFRRKYIKGLYPSTSTIYYVPSNSSVVYDNWVSADDGMTSEYTGYLKTNDPGEYSTLLKIPTSAYSESIGEWESLSSDQINEYPHSGVLNGMTYQFLGKISDMAVSHATPPPMTIVNYTNANFVNGFFNADIPYDRFLFTLNNSTIRVRGVVTKGNLMAEWEPFTGSSDITKGYLGTYYPEGEDVNAANAVIAVTSGGLKIKNTSSSGKLMYMKI